MSNMFSEEQLSLRAAAKDLFAAECSFETLLAELESDAQPDPKRWNLMSEMGLLAVTVPEEFGGLGLSVSDLGLILEEVGYAALPEPLMETAALFVPALTRYGSNEQRERWLPAIASGEAMPTYQPMAAAGAAYGTIADVALIEDPKGLFLVEASQADIMSVQSMDQARRLGRFDRGTATTLAGPQAVAELKTHGRSAAAAVLNGVSRRLVDESVDYAKERQQFGRPIGSFQAVKHLLAEAVAGVETARPAAWAALADTASGAEARHYAAAVAKSSANSAATTASYHALQVHGGIGFTWEHHLHIWLKRGKALEELYGAANELDRELGSLVLEAGDLVEEFGPKITTA